MFPYPTLGKKKKEVTTFANLSIWLVGFFIGPKKSENLETKGFSGVLGMESSFRGEGGRQEMETAGVGDFL